MAAQGAARAACLTALLAAGAPAWAQAADVAPAPDQALKQVEQDLAKEKARSADLARRSADARKALAGLQGRLVAAAEKVRRQDEAVLELDASLDALAKRERAESDALDGQRRQMASLLGALERMSRTPPEALIARPEAPVDALRSALLLRAAVPTLRLRADALATALTALATTRAALDARKDEVAAARALLAKSEDEVQSLITDRETTYRQLEAERGDAAQDMAKLATQATGLRDLIEKIEAARRAEEQKQAAEAARQRAEEEAAQRVAEEQARQRAEADEAAQAASKRQQEMASLPPGEPGADAPSASAPLKNGLMLPAAGQVIVRYGEADRDGATSRGLVISARPGAEVVAPYTGVIMFAGPFRGYGQILIVEHAHGYHSLIAGLGRIETAVGRQVLAGEPVGFMADEPNGNPELYFELRHNGQPINPQRGFAVSDGKGQG